MNIVRAMRSPGRKPYDSEREPALIRFWAGLIEGSEIHFKKAKGEQYVDGL